ncbi:MAG TPA: hypothetical protein VNO21_21255, partial [Polyangiaceae bacterium]|nr:hypothetical protein [Polyangiaceae bacterium]
MSREKVQELIGAVLEAIDSEKLERGLLAVLTPVAPPHPGPPRSTSEGGEGADVEFRHGGEGAARLVNQLALVDLLDESILGARAGDKSYPLRVFFATLGSTLSAGEHEETAFPLACAFGLYFRVAMDEEAKMRIGLEASRLYYRFTEDIGLEGRAQISPLLATLMNGELEHLRFESADHQTIFDSQFHERSKGAAAASSRIAAPESFLCRVGASGLVRVRAEV